MCLSETDDNIGKYTNDNDDDNRGKKVAKF